MKQNPYRQNSPKFKAEIVEIETKLIPLSHLYRPLTPGLVSAHSI